jgi:hypothetical protein
MCREGGGSRRRCWIGVQVLHVHHKGWGASHSSSHTEFLKGCCEGARPTHCPPSTRPHPACGCALAHAHLNGHPGDAQAEGPPPVAGAAAGTGSVHAAAAGTGGLAHVLPIKAALHVGHRLCGIQGCQELCCGLECPSVCSCYCCSCPCAAHAVTLILAGSACNSHVPRQTTRLVDTPCLQQGCIPPWQLAAGYRANAHLCRHWLRCGILWPAR